MRKPAPPAQGGLIDGTQGKSSKRLSSLLGLAAALLFPLLVGFFKLKLPVAELTGAFLIYSAAMQGVSYLQERRKK